MSVQGYESQFERTEDVADINDAFEDIFLTEERIIDESFNQGLEDGRQEESVDEARKYGYRKGSEIGREIGYYQTIVQSFTVEPNVIANAKTQAIVKELLASIETYPRDNDPSVDLLHNVQQIRNKFRRLCALLKVPFKYVQPNDLSF